jgi:hypothetical protein
MLGAISGADHEDDQQHQHDVDERHHVDFADQVALRPGETTAGMAIPGLAA